MTNFERIKKMNLDEFALRFGHCICGMIKKYELCICGPQKCTACVRRWLNQEEVKDDDKRRDAGSACGHAGGIS